MAICQEKKQPKKCCIRRMNKVKVHFLNFVQALGLVQTDKAFFMGKLLFNSPEEIHFLRR